MTVVGLGAFVITFFEPHKLWIDEVVDKAFPAPVMIAVSDYYHCRHGDM